MLLIPAPTIHPDAPPRSGSHVSLSEVLAALSHALDLTEGQPPGHTLRACVIGMRLAEEIGLGDEDRSALYYALLLKDSGCSSNAARIASVFGANDQAVKYRMKLVDWHRRIPLALQTARTVGLGGPLQLKVRQFFEIARTDDVTRSLIQIRCDRGAEIVLQLGFPTATAEAIRSLDEHWNGKGYPLGRRGAEIPVLSRIANLAQSVEIFFSANGVEQALRVARARRGAWFDPRLVDVLLGWRQEASWWQALSDPEIAQMVVAAEPGLQARAVDDAGLDAIAGAFARIIDTKSPFTFRHSFNVAAYARAIARELGLGATEERRLYRAGLLHDIGKLGISNRILDKPGKLTADELLAVESHPVYTWEILGRVAAFDDFAWLAALHHEKLDGSGYPWKLTAEQLDLPAGILAVADIYEALTADRPYRPGMTPRAALAILQRESGVRLRAEAIEGLELFLRP